MGCTTVGLLLVVRTEARREEFATCLALGATRTRLARGIILEGAMLTLAAAALSPLVAWWLFSAVSAFQLPGGIALGLLDLSLDRRSVAVILTAAAGVTLVIGVIAGAFGFRADIADAVRARTGVTPRFGRGGTRAVLLATQVAIALALIAGSSIGLKSGLYGGRNRICAPTASIARRTSGCLCTARLSSTTTSPGRNVGTRTCST